ncbi:glycoside hydrolase family 92 protein [Cyathus striatus]|nr:glycoside hydrolase family 92 protein [Cyathus striatus]
MCKPLLIPVLLAASVASTSFKAPPAFAQPESENIDAVNLLIGNGGDTPNGSGGMIPSTAPPFAMTRWVAQTQVNYVSATPYNWTHDKIHGFQATRQPAIWMGESGPIAVVPGVAENADPEKIKVDFDERGLEFMRDENGERKEVITPAYYNVELDDGNRGKIFIEQSATSRVGHLRFKFSPYLSHTPYLLFEAARPSIITSTPTNITHPEGGIFIPSTQNEICGFSSERQDHIITPTSTQANASLFKGYFCARFNRPFKSGIIYNGSVYPVRKAEGALLSAYAFFEPKEGESEVVVDVRIGTSFISIVQARNNIDLEIPDSETSPPTLEATAEKVRAEWVEKLDRVKLEGANDAQKSVFLTGLVHALQYPSEQFEIVEGPEGQRIMAYYSAYENVVKRGDSYTGYSIWDTFRAAWSWQILLAPERIGGMVRSMLQDFEEGGWLPMWKNIAETNIMVGTHADSLIAEAVLKGVIGFDTNTAWDAVWKDATVPPERDWETEYADRQENVDYEVRAGLTSVYAEKGWVANDVHSESASRTLDYAYDDYAAYVLARELGKPENVTNFLLDRSMKAPFTIFNSESGFMEARNADGSWAGEDEGWTEGDKWAYSFDVVHDIPSLIEHRGGNISFVKSLEAHFNGGHNDHTNEPSHHIPYLYALAGAAYKTQERVRAIAKDDYNNTPIGLSGNEDCGQMSAWYMFSALGFYPVNPVSGEYVVGSPLFDKITIFLPPRPWAADTNTPKMLTIIASGAPTKPYIKSLTVNGQRIGIPFIHHDQIADGGEIVFEMSDKIEAWGNDDAVLQSLKEEGVEDIADEDIVTVEDTTEPQEQVGGFWWVYITSILDLMDTLL